MNQYLIIGLIFIIIIIAGCVTNNQKEETTLIGNYQSVRGVMDPLSCYCFNAGYLTTPDNDKILICFEKDDENINCENIQVMGSYQSKKINSEPTNPCPSGEMTLLYVSSYECK